ncbi:hypothetical protein AN964_05930 [Heyndrickxia shackletonii]|uniref:Uncharacterized protein n=1 Tax=Heyndrickxia shackletonii TaxID=157838 RepID=A0A0Q3TGH9_9BACI|nr:hypothetical protein [Heyndrickxia shackletonii]KQL53094.1 hypothetical protein AN964_05930 [Heyndrickxia shackletonii]NEZ02377.1 hypothetical protein [Heyndrickxia shackletonii]
MTTKFKRSIIHYSSVRDIEMVIEELFEEIDEKISDYEQKQAKYQLEGCNFLSDETHGKIIGLLLMKCYLRDKLSEVRERYKP